MRKERNKLRRNPFQTDQPSGKRRKLNEKEYRETKTDWGKPEGGKIGEKRKGGDGKEDEKGNPGKRLRQMKL
jgi:hypothetical protein